MVMPATPTLKVNVPPIFKVPVVVWELPAFATFAGALDARLPISTVLASKMPVSIDRIAVVAQPVVPVLADRVSVLTSMSVAWPSRSKVMTGIASVVLAMLAMFSVERPVPRRLRSVKEPVLVRKPRSRPARSPPKLTVSVQNVLEVEPRRTFSSTPIGELVEISAAMTVLIGAKRIVEPPPPVPAPPLVVEASPTRNVPVARLA